MKMLRTVEHQSVEFPNKFGVLYEVNNVSDFYDMLKWGSETFKYTPAFGQDQDYTKPTGYFWFKTENDRNFFILRWS